MTAIESMPASTSPATYVDETEREQSQRLAEARYHLAHMHDGMPPAWDGLSDDEQEASTLEARNYLRAARHAGLITATRPVGDPHRSACLNCQAGIWLAPNGRRWMDDSGWDWCAGTTNRHVPQSAER